MRLCHVKEKTKRLQNGKREWQKKLSGSQRMATVLLNTEKKSDEMLLKEKEEN